MATEANNYTKTAIRNINQRLDKFEVSVMEKLEQLTDAMIKLARTEEKLINYDAKFGYVEAHQKKLEAQIETLFSRLNKISCESAVSGVKTDIYGTILKKGAWCFFLGLSAFMGANAETIIGHLLKAFGG